MLGAVSEKPATVDEAACHSHRCSAHLEGMQEAVELLALVTRVVWWCGGARAWACMGRAVLAPGHADSPLADFCAVEAITAALALRLAGRDGLQRRNAGAARCWAGDELWC